MAKSIDIVLNAIDQTGPATESASQNIAKFAQTTAQAGSTASDESSGGGWISSIIGGLFAIPSAATIAAAAFAGLGIAVATNFMGLRDIVGNVAQGIGDAIQYIIDGSINWSEIWNELVRGIVSGFAVVEYAFRGWREIGLLAITGMQIAMVQFVDYVVYAFNTLLPGIFKALTDNLQNTAALIKVTINQMTGKESSAEDAVRAAFAVGGLAAIPERKVSELEKQLQDVFDNLLKTAGKGVSDNINLRVSQIPEIAKFLQAKIPALKAQGIDLFKNIFGLNEGGKVSLQLPGLEESRFLTGVKAGGEEKMASIEAENKKQTGIMQFIADAIGANIAQPIKDGVKAGIEGAKSSGFNVFPNQ